MLRLFAALALPPDISEGLKRHQTGLVGARWRPEEALHITLAFYGEMDRHRAEDLAAELSRIHQSPFSLELAGVGAFDDGSGQSRSSSARAVWAGLEASEPLVLLASRARAAGQRAGLRMEARRYVPHVTLAYLKGTPDDRLAAWITGHNRLHSPSFRVDRFGLYSSELTHAGSHYTLLREYLL
ncbi:MAG: RNA 2',3'-cyclic phosphodiesterase [Brevundimonas sp.]|jgi:2'-5' RNA ligase|uniref:RNA 2',3'-cyclic phosphodiesterase n=1 Tax=Brevundimonas sp. TaxID=1871086 RepID=UPI00391966BA